MYDNKQTLIPMGDNARLISVFRCWPIIQPYNVYTVARMKIQPKKNVLTSHCPSDKYTYDVTPYGGHLTHWM